MSSAMASDRDEFGRTIADLGDFFTPEDADALRQFASIDDLLTDEERAKLHADLREIAACRRRALDASANWQMP